MGKYYLGTGTNQYNFQVVDSTGVIQDLNLSGLYLSITGKAADADKLDNYDSSFFRNIANLTGTYTGAISGKASDSELLDGFDSSYFLNGANITGTVQLSGTFTGYYTGAFSGTITHTDSITFHTGLGINPDPAELAWNDGIGTMQLGLQGGNVDLRVGLQNYEYVTNRNASTLSKGSVVYISGAQGNRPAVALALANADSTSAVTFGILAEDIASMANGYAITNGLLTNLNTTGFAEGAALYLSPTISGAVISSKPQAPNHSVLVGFCVRSHQSAGEILVKIQNGVELDELHDVRIISAQNNDIIRYNAPSGVWFNSNTLALNGTGSHYISGDLGIGTSAPTARLHIVGADKRQIISSTTDNAALVLGQWDGATNRIESSTRKLLITSYASGISLGVNGSENVHVSTSGNLGVGTLTPAQKLTIGNGGKIAVYTAGDGRRGLFFNDGTGTWLESDSSGSDPLLLSSPGTNGSIRLYTNGTEKARLDNNGNFGIGSTGPNSKLTIGTDFASIAGITVDTAGGTDSQLVLRKAASKPAFGVLTWDNEVYLSAGIYYDGGTWVHHNSNNSNQLFVMRPGTGVAWYASNNGTGSWDAGSNVILWDHSGYWKNLVQSTASGSSYFTGGNVGVGTASPSNKLDVAVSTASSTFLTDANVYAFAIKNTDTTAGNAVAMTFGHGGSTYTNFIASVRTGVGSIPTGDLVFGGRPADNTNFVERVRIVGTTGNVGIGSTSPNQKLEIKGGNVRIDNRAAGSYSASDLEFLSGDSSGSWNVFKIRYTKNATLDRLEFIDGGNSNAFVIANGGNITALGTITTTSNASVALSVTGGARAQSFEAIGTPAVYNTTGGLTIAGYAGSPYALIKAYSDGSGTEKALVLNSSGGNVGIGTTTPLGKLHIAGGSSSTGVQLYVSPNTGYTNPVAGDQVHPGGSKIILWDDTITPQKASIGMDSNADIWFNNAGAQGGAGFTFYTGNGASASPTARLKITKDGNVGIATTTPNAPLDISAAYPGSTTGRNSWAELGRITVGATYNGYGVIGEGFYTSGSIYKYKYNDTAAVIDFATGNFAFKSVGVGTINTQITWNDLMYLKSDGRVGIGTTSPSSILDARLSSGATSGFRFKGYSDASTDYLLSLGTQTYPDVFQVKSVNGLVTMGVVGAVGATPDLVLQTNSTERIRILSGGNVGIGVTAPDAKLQVDGHVHIGNANAWDNVGSWNRTILVDGTNHARIRLRATAYAPGNNNLNEVYLWVDNSVAAPYGGLYADYGLRIGSGNSSHIALLPAGNVGIGITNPGDKLTVVQNSNDIIIRSKTTTAGAWFVADSASDGYFGLILHQGATEKWRIGQTDGSADLSIKRTGSDVVRITSIGNVGIGTTSPEAKLDVSGTIAGTNLYGQIGHSSGGRVRFWADTAGANFISNYWVTYNNTNTRWEWNATTSVGGVKLDFPNSGVFAVNVKSSAAVTAGNPVNFVTALSVSDTTTTVSGNLTVSGDVLLPTNSAYRLNGKVALLYNGSNLFIQPNNDLGNIVIGATAQTTYGFTVGGNLTVSGASESLFGNNGNQQLGVRIRNTTDGSNSAAYTVWQSDAGALNFYQTATSSNISGNATRYPAATSLFDSTSTGGFQWNAAAAKAMTLASGGHLGIVGNLTVSGGTETIDATSGTASATLNLIGRSSGVAKTASIAANSAGSLVLSAEGAGSSMTIAANTGNTTIAYNLAVNGDITSSTSTNVGQTIRVTNSNANTSALSRLAVSNGTYEGSITVYGTGFTTNNAAHQNRMTIAAPFICHNVSGQHYWWIGTTGAGHDPTNANQVMILTTGGQFITMPPSYSYSAWGLDGINTSFRARTVTDSSTAASGTAASAVMHSFGASALAATNTSVTTTNAATVYIAGGPSAGTNQTITNSWGLWNAGKTRLDGDVTVGGNLTINGTTTTVNSTVTTIDDPIITLGGDTAPTVDDNKDRGVEFRWHNGSAAKVGFFGFDDSTGYFTFIADATNTSEVFSGTQGDIQASNFRGTLVGSISNALTAGSYLTGSPSSTYNGSAAVTFAVDATSANTANKVVARDGNGDFSARIITATTFNGALSGNSSTTTKLNVTDSRNTADTPETISMGIVADFKANSTNSLSDGGTYNGVLTFRQYGSGTDWSGGRSHQLAFTDNDNIWHRSGTSTSWGTWYKIWHQNNDGAGSGLDADLLDGYNQDTANTANTVVRRDASGNFSAGTISATSLRYNTMDTDDRYARLVRGTVSNVSNAGYTCAFTVSGSALASSIRFTAQGTADSVVVNSMIDLIVNHSQDIVIQSLSGIYTQLTVRVVSDNNENFAVLFTTNHANAVSLNVEVYTYNNETVVFTAINPYSSNTLTHVCYPGIATSATGGNNGDLRVAGTIYGNVTGNVTGTAGGETLSTVTSRGASTSTNLAFNGNVVQGGGTARSTYGTTIALNRSTIFSANSDVGDGERFLSIVNDNSTTNAMATLGFRINPNGGNANAVLDMKFVNTGATSTSKLHYSFNHGGSWADRLTIQSDGNVGIGTTTPNYKLQVQGTAYVDSTLFVNGAATIEDTLTVKTQSGSHNVAIIDYSGVAGGRIKVLVDGTVRSQIGTYSADDTFFNVGYGGKVGICTSSPQTPLHAYASTTDSTTAGRTTALNVLTLESENTADLEYTGFGQGLVFRGSTYNNATQRTLGRIVHKINDNSASTTIGTSIHFETSDNATNTNAPTEKMVINYAGNVGIGTTTPSAKLDVSGDSVQNVGLVRFTNNYASGNVYYPTASFIQTRANHSYGIVSEFRTNTAADSDRPSILFYAAQAAHSWQVGQVTSGWGTNDNFGIGYRASNTPGSFSAWPTNYFTITTGGNVGIGVTGPSEKLHIAGTVRIDGTTNGLRIFKDGGAAVTSTLYLANSGNTRAYNWQLNSSGDGLDFFTYDGNAWAYKITYLANGNVGIGTQAPSYKLEVNGSFAATTKSFVIPHPTKEGKKLRYGSLEGPENGVYIRGKTTSKVIELPDYWTKLVDPDSITVQLTPIGSHQKLYVEKIEDNKVYIANENLLAKSINCFFYILAERADVEKLQVEIDA